MDKSIRIVLYASADAEELSASIGMRFAEARILSAGSQEDFREAIDIFKPELVLLDYATIGSAGLEAMESMHANAPRVPFICLMDGPDEALEAGCMAKGAWNVIEKSRLWRIEVAIKRCITQINLMREYHRTLEVLREGEARYRSMLEVAPVAVVIHCDGLVRYINPTGLRLLGADLKEQIVGLPVSRFMSPDSLDAGLERLRRLYAGEHGMYPVEDVYFRLDGTPRQIEISSSLISDQGQLAVQAIITDITDRKNIEESYRYLSYHDHLTGLNNRRYFEEELHRIDTEENLPISIVIGDVNGLKEVNDTLGHDAGDEIIIKAAEVIRKGCRNSDIVARVGGDEFAVILPKTERAEAEAIVTHIGRHALDRSVCGKTLSISLGLATKRTRLQSISATVAKAENAMYKKKRTAHENR